jgi:hypothetical protein
VYDARGLVAQHHGLLNNKVPDAALDPVVHIGAANAGPFGLYEDVVRGGELGDRAIFVCYFVGGLEYEGGVLWWLLVRVNMRIAGSWWGSWLELCYLLSFGRHDCCCVSSTLSNNWYRDISID